MTREILYTVLKIFYKRTYWKNVLKIPSNLQPGFFRPGYFQPRFRIPVIFSPEPGLGLDSGPVQVFPGQGRISRSGPDFFPSFWFLFPFPSFNPNNTQNFEKSIPIPIMGAMGLYITLVATNTIFIFVRFRKIMTSKISVFLPLK